MIVGNEQRVYGTLVSDCYIWLHRFALVNDKTHSPSDPGAPVYYGDNSTYAKITNCGYLYNGYFTIRFVLEPQSDEAEAIFEVRKCRTGRNYIFIETYGEKIPSYFVSIWFNKGTEAVPDWVKLNDNFTTNTLEYKEDIFSFRETKSQSQTYEIGCCKPCSTKCVCLNCSIQSRIAFRTSAVGQLNPLPTTPDDPRLFGYPTHYKFLGYGITNHGTETYIWEDGGGSVYDLYFEYKFDCDNIEIWAGDYNSHLYWDYTFYLDDNDVWHLLTYSGNGILATVFHGTFPFDYLAHCTTNEISFTGCTTFPILFPLPVNASLWNYTLPDLTATLTAKITSTPTNKCLNGDTYDDYTWDLNYNSSPAILKTGKIVSHTFDPPTITMGPTLTGLTKSYNVLVCSGEIYTDKIPKTIEKITNGCININVTSPTKSWYSMYGGQGTVINDMICVSIGEFTHGNGGVISLSISTTPDDNAIHIVSYGIDYWIKVGFLECGGTAGGVLYSTGSGLISSYCLSGRCYNNLINSSITSITNSFEFNIDNSISSGCIFNDRFIGGTGTWNGTYEGDSTGVLFDQIYDINGVYDSILSNIPHTKTIADVSGAYAMIPFNNKLYVFAITSQKFTMLSNLNDFGSTAVSFSAPSGFQVRTCCEHNGKLYGTCRDSHQLVVFDGNQTFIDTGIVMSYGHVSLISYNNYLIGISNSADNQFIPAIDIIPNSML